MSRRPPARVEAWYGAHDFGPEEHTDTIVGQIEVTWLAERRSLRWRLWVREREITEALAAAVALAQGGPTLQPPRRLVVGAT